MTVDQQLAAVRKWLSKERCPHCDGLGEMAVLRGYRKCRECNGTGKPPAIVALEKVLETFAGWLGREQPYRNHAIAYISDIYTTLRDAGCVPEQEAKDDTSD